MLYEVRSQNASKAHSAASKRSCAPVEPSVFSLIECPPVGRGNFILLKRAAGGGGELLAMGRLQQDCETLNLAHIRKLGAELGANEVRIFPSPV